MDKLNMMTTHTATSNIELIGHWFPHVLTEMHDEQGEVRRAIDFELLKQELSASIVDHTMDDKVEKYQFNWPGKKAALSYANESTSRTLIPIRQGSVNWDHTNNLFIEGEHVEVLKLLRRSYGSAVKLIYIDLVLAAQEASPRANGFGSQSELQSDGLSRLYAGLKLSRSLLCEDGVFVVCTSTARLANALKLMEEVFGPTNSVAHILWQKEACADPEHIIIYSRNKQLLLLDSYVKERLQSLDSWWSRDMLGMDYEACDQDQLQRLFPQHIFPTGKPQQLFHDLFRLINVQSEDIVLDLFAKQTSIAHAIMTMNAEDKGSRQYILVQFPERTKTSSYAAQAGYRTLSQLGRERILRAAHHIKSKTRAEVDYGYRLFRLDSSHWGERHSSTPGHKQLGAMNGMRTNRTEEGLLFQVMLELGLNLSLQVTTIEITGTPLLIIEDNLVIACFAQRVPITVIQYIVKQQQQIVVVLMEEVQVIDHNLTLDEIVSMLPSDTVVKLL